jgi:hypothetical protein
MPLAAGRRPHHHLQADQLGGRGVRAAAGFSARARGRGRRGRGVSARAVVLASLRKASLSPGASGTWTWLAVWTALACLSIGEFFQLKCISTRGG